MRIIIFLLISALLIQRLQSDWQVQNTGQSVSLIAITFVNENTGWACGYAMFPIEIALVKTTNGGTTWTSQAGNGSFYRLMTTDFINENTGWVMGTDAGIYKTTDGGASYTHQTAYYGFWFDCVFFDSNTGIASGLNGTKEVLIRTENGGANWYLRTLDVYPAFNAVYFLNINTGYGVTYPGSIYKTTTGGINWVLYSVGSNVQINGVFFPDMNTGYVAGANGLIYKTTNAGANWVMQNSSVTNELRSVYFNDVNTGWICGSSGTVLKTTNGGTNWHRQITNSTAFLAEVIFVNSNTGYAAGSSGIVLKTTDGGGPIGIKPIGNEISESFMLHQNYPNPFNPTTRIRFSIPSTGVQYNEHLQLKVYDIPGREITTLVNEKLQAGTYEVEFDGSNYASGVYYYTLIIGDYKETKKMVLLR